MSVGRWRRGVARDPKSLFSLLLSSFRFVFSLCPLHRHLDALLFFFFFFFSLLSSSLSLLFLSFFLLSSFSSFSSFFLYWGGDDDLSLILKSKAPDWVTTQKQQQKEIDLTVRKEKYGEGSTKCLLDPFPPCSFSFVCYPLPFLRHLPSS